MSDKINVNFVHLMPILVSLLFGLVCAFLILTSPIEIYQITPFPEDVTGSFSNAFYFVILVAISASLLYLLLKRKNHKVVTLVTAFALTTAFFVLSLFYLSSVLFSIPNSEILTLILSAIITVVADLAIFKLGSKACNIVVICLGGALGIFLGVSIPTLSAFLILSFLAIYDAFAVYYGPVGKIARTGLDQLRGLSFSFRNIQMGLGDLTFYSMLSGIMFFNFGVVPCFVSIAGILLGCLLTFAMLEKRGMFPGLPFPIFLGLATGLLTSFML